MILDKSTAATWGGDEMVDKIEKDLGYKIDWQAVAKQDAIDAKHMRELVKMPESSGADAGEASGR